MIKGCDRGMAATLFFNERPGICRSSLISAAGKTTLGQQR
jgi:hypothetical protein